MTYQADTQIRNSTFKRNAAGSAGGSLYFSCSNSRLCQFDVRGNTFSQSNAGEKGGAIFYDLYQPSGLSDNRYD